MKIKMKFKKLTKYTYVYEEVDDMGVPMLDTAISALYIKQRALPSRPEYIEVVIGRIGETDG